MPTRSPGSLPSRTPPGSARPSGTRASATRRPSQGTANHVRRGNESVVTDWASRHPTSPASAAKATTTPGTSPGNSGAYVNPDAPTPNPRPTMPGPTPPTSTITPIVPSTTVSRPATITSTTPVESERRRIRGY